MTFKYKGHNYHTQFKHTLNTFMHWWSIKGFISAVWRGEPYLVLFGHGDNCCDYWTPVSDPKAQRAFMLDDELALVSGSSGEPSKHTVATQESPSAQLSKEEDK